MKIVCLAALAGLLAMSSARAQNVVMMNGNGNFPNFIRPGSTSDRSQTMTVNFQFSMPTKPPTSDADITKTMAEASQLLYGIVDQECSVLAAALKGNCHIVQMNIGGNINVRNNPQATVMANASATFEIAAVVPGDPPPAK